MHAHQLQQGESGCWGAGLHLDIPSIDGGIIAGHMPPRPPPATVLVFAPVMMLAQDRALVGAELCAPSVCGHVGIDGHSGKEQVCFFLCLVLYW